MTVESTPIFVLNRPGDWSTGTGSALVGGRERLPEVRILGARFHAITQQECVRFVFDELDTGRGGWIITMNLEMVRQFVQEEGCAECYSSASLSLCDGMPLIWASHLQGTPLPERVTGSDLLWKLSGAAAEGGRSIFLLGGNPYAANRTAQVLVYRYPTLHVSGIECPAPGFEKDIEEVWRLKEALNLAHPDIVYVALGSPKQEQFIQCLRESLPEAWWLGVGIGFSFVSGEIPRAPLWMQRAGLEWLHRLMMEPRRLARRYLWHGIPFALTLFVRAVWLGLARRT